MSGYYLNVGSCVACSIENCNTCLSESTCSECTTGYYYSPSSLTCEICDKSCLTCTTSLTISCTSCNKG